MTKRLIKTRKDHRRLRAVIKENVVTQTMSPAAGALAAGVIGTPHATVQFALSAPVGSASFSLASGALPAGMVLSTGGLLAGTPTGPAANASFSIRGTDDYGNTVVNAYTLNVTA